MMIANPALFTEISSRMSEIFGGDIPQLPISLPQVAARAAVIFLIGLTIIRIGRNRMVSRLTALDVLFGFVVGSLLSRGISGSAPISGTTVACASIAIVHWLLTWMSCRWHAVGILVKGSETLLIREGEPQPENLRKAYISRHDLQAELRLQGVADMKEVHHAYEERNGEVSVLKKPQVFDIAVKDGIQTVRIQIS